MTARRLHSALSSPIAERLLLALVSALLVTGQTVGGCWVAEVKASIKSVSEAATMSIGAVTRSLEDVAREQRATNNQVITLTANYGEMTRNIDAIRVDLHDNRKTLETLQKGSP